ncbi:TIR domain protein [Candidatus Norongarragalina meridionalis]|nr:TIR domain protein [Candidatus Norongarragalina meridionalis]
MTQYAGFDEDTTKTLIEALNFTRSRFAEKLKDKLTKLGPAYVSIVKEEARQTLQTLKNAQEIVETNMDRLYESNDEEQKKLMNILASTLRFYLLDLQNTAKTENSATIERKMEEVNRVLLLKTFENAKGDLFLRYSRVELPSEPDKMLVFVCYKASEDKELAGRLKTLFEREGEVSAFVAHDDIRVGENWAHEIRKNLGQACAFVPLITKNFKESFWTNQETGFAEGRGTEIYPIIIDGELPGFLAERQGEHATLDKLEDAVKKILERVKHSRNKRGS